MIYIASALDNWRRVRSIRDKFSDTGISLSYDWSKHGEDEVPESEAILFARAELDGIKKSSCLLLITPGNRGTHWESGYAYALGIPIIMLCDDRYVEHSVYCLPGVTKYFTEEEAIEAVRRIDSNGQL